MTEIRASLHILPMKLFLLFAVLYINALVCQAAYSANTSAIQKQATEHVSEHFFQWMFSPDIFQLLTNTAVKVYPNVASVLAHCQLTGGQERHLCLTKNMSELLCNSMQKGSMTGCAMPLYLQLLNKKKQAFKELLGARPTKSFFVHENIKMHAVHSKESSLQARFHSVLSEQLSSWEKPIHEILDIELFYLFVNALYLFNEEELLNDAFKHLELKISTIIYESDDFRDEEYQQAYRDVLIGVFQNEKSEVYLKISELQLKALVSRVHQEISPKSIWHDYGYAAAAAGIAISLFVIKTCINAFRKIRKFRRLHTEGLARWCAQRTKADSSPESTKTVTFTLFFC